jgi:hypothetical protein
VEINLNSQSVPNSLNTHKINYDTHNARKRALYLSKISIYVFVDSMG